MTDLARLIDLLLPIVETVAERRALLREALGARSPLLGDITRDGAPREFLVNALAVLARESDALDALLDVAKDRVGTDAAAQIEALRPALHAWAEAGADVTLFAPRPLSAPDQPVFLSYSRADRDSVVGLYKELSEAGIPLWRDVHDIPAGSPDWWGEIRAAIDACSSTVLCLSLHALRSTVVSDEWNYARKRGKRVIPVIVDEVFNHPDVQAGRVIVPLWMRTANWVDLRPDAPERAAGFSNLLKTLRMPYTPRPTYITVKASQLPHNFVPRPREFEPLVEALAVSPPTEAGTTVALTAALRGAGGYGKTTLAKALCRDWRVSGAYPDGVHWVTLGEKLLELSREVREAELVARLLDLVKEITRERPNVARLDAAQEELKKAVEDRRLLIVIDDAWAAAHVRPFLAPGRYCAVVITTRFDECIPKGGAVVRRQIDQMDEENALALLSFGVEGWEAERAWFEEVAFKRLGRSAQLLGIINSAIAERLAPDARGQVKPLRQALAEVKARLDYYGVTAFQPEETEERERAFGRTLEVGIERLRSEEQARYRNLGIFPQDVPIPLTTLAALWGLEAIPTQDFCEKLAKSSLVQDYDERTLTVHDVTLNYLRGKLTDAPAVHARLLDAWGDPLSPLPQGEGSGVRGLPDAYAWRWYGYHLIAAGRAERLRALLLDYRYLRAKLDATDVEALIADCDAALTLHPAPKGEGLQPPRHEGEGAGGEGTAIRLLRSALTMSAHALRADKAQLAAQLNGRLYRHADQDAIAALRTACAADAPLLALDNGFDALLPAGGALLATFIGHTDCVNGALALEDGTILSWSDDGTLRHWGRDGTALATFVGHTDCVNGALALEDGTILSWSDDGTLRHWGRDGTALATFVGHTDCVNGALALEDGTILSWSDDGTLRHWGRDGTALATFVGHTDCVNGALALEDGTILSWSDDGTLRHWGRDGTALATFVGHTDCVNSALALEDGTILSWSDDATLRRWTRDGTLLTTFIGHEVDVWGAVALSDGTIMSWSSEKDLMAAPRGYFSFELGNVDDYRGEILRRWMLDSTEMGKLEIYSPYPSNWDREEVFAWARAQGFDANVFFARLGDPLVTGGRAAWRDNTVYVYDQAGGRTMARFTGDAEITCLALSGDVIAAGDAAGRVVFLRWRRPAR